MLLNCMKATFVPKSAHFVWDAAGFPHVTCSAHVVKPWSVLMPAVHTEQTGLSND